MTIKLRTLLVTALLLLGLGGVAGFFFLRQGLYDISAINQHTRPLFIVLDHAMRWSIQARAGSQAPEDLGAPGRVQAGAGHYVQHCLQCHGAPGVAPYPLAFGLTPAPANLLSAGRTWRSTEIFWVIKNGVKMTGMPAWAYRLTDEEVWDIVAFVQAMPRMTPGDYADLRSQLPAPPAAALSHPVQQVQQVQQVQPPGAGPPGLPTASVQAGRQATARYLCATCHVIPGLVSASSHVGPSLEGMGRRAFIGGVLPNTPENMVRWLKDPKQIAPLTAMPALGLTDQDARDISAFLRTLDK